MLREGLGPDIDIAVDFHAKTSPTVASVIIKELDPLHLLWVEEPHNSLTRLTGIFGISHERASCDRKGPKIFVGEWATREGTPTPNFGSALGDAAFMTGLERNSDLVVMAAYAPLFVNVNPGGMQWSTDLIGYDALNSYGSPAYHAQVIFASCLGDHTPESSLSGAGEKVFYSVTATAKSRVCMKLVNAASTAQPVTISLKGLGDGTHKATLHP